MAFVFPTRPRFFLNHTAMHPPRVCLEFMYREEPESVTELISVCLSKAVIPTSGATSVRVIPQSLVVLKMLL